MRQRWNALQWEGRLGHYEVYYLTLTDHGSGLGLWIRYTMVAPLAGTGELPTCSLWFCAMDPARPERNVGRKVSFPIGRMSAQEGAFHLRIDDAWLSDQGAAGAISQDGMHASWDLRWTPSLPAYGHVHPLLRANLAKTVLFLPHPDLEVQGVIEIDGHRVELAGARGGQAHLWGSKHAQRWAWAHCNDFTGPDGHPRPGTFVDGVSVFVPRFGRELGPNTPVVGRLSGRDLLSTSPLAVQRNPSEFGLETWAFEARTRNRKVAGHVEARREDLVGVTYHDPDGELAYCYNTEVASMRLDLLERQRPGRPWRKVDELRSDRRAHFEYAQRTPVEGAVLHIR